MNWEAIGAIGEIVGAAAVVGTLAYLAMQIRQNTRSDYASRQIALQSEFTRMHEQIASNPALAELAARCRNIELKDLSLSEEEIVESFANAFANTYASIDLTYQAGQMQRDVYLVYCHDFERQMAKYPSIIPRWRAIVERDRADHSPQQNAHRLYRLVDHDRSGGIDARRSMNDQHAGLHQFLAEEPS